MFEWSIDKQQLLTPLLMVSNAVDKKQTVSILSHVLVRYKDQHVSLTATDMEIEMTAHLQGTSLSQEGNFTLPTKKTIDILRHLDDQVTPCFTLNDQMVSIKVGHSQFKLATLPAVNYPVSQQEKNHFEQSIDKSALNHLLQSTQFALAQQDVRVFLNSLLLEWDAHAITAVATDGHRMAISRYLSDFDTTLQRLLIPRKAVQEIIRLLTQIEDDNVLIGAGPNHLRVSTQQFTLTSKLIDTRFPAYAKTIPKHQDKHVLIDREQFKRALARAMVLANEKSHVITLHLQPNHLALIANNQEQEEAFELITAETSGNELKIAVNANYLLDVLNYVATTRIHLSFSDQNSSILLKSDPNDLFQYIIMPIKV